MATLERQLIKPELTQRREEGCDVAEIEQKVQNAIDDDAMDDQVFVELYDELIALNPDPAFPYEEPSDLAAIQALRPAGPRQMDLTTSEDILQDRIYGGWLGRAAGCSLGKPVEGWPRKRIDDYLANNNALPLDDYIPFVEGAINKYLKSSTRGNIEFMARDDDLDYPILGLIALERRGSQLGPRDMANTWLSYMPFNMLYTAENVAYRNLVNRRLPPESASYRNPYREWIGAQIRADIFGYVTPGWPEKAAALAYQDACISHVKNGIYGEMLMAAMIAASFVVDDVEQIIEIGLSEIPANCRLAEAVHDTVGWCKESNDWEVVWDRIFEKYGHYHTVHTINNAALVVMGLMFGATDYEQGIVLSVRGGWDTDCNGATVGSILGTKMGAAQLPEKWVGVLSNRLKSVVRDFNDNQISDLAERTYKMAKTIFDEPEEVKATPPTISEASGSVVGRWKMDFEHADYFLVVNDDYSGAMTAPLLNETSELRNVKVSGDRIRFMFSINKGDTESEVDFVGTVKGNHLEAQCVAAGFEFELNGIRQ